LLISSRQKRLRSALRKFNASPDRCRHNFEGWWRYERGSVLWPRERSENMSVRQSVVLHTMRPYGVA